MFKVTGFFSRPLFSFSQLFMGGFQGFLNDTLPDYSLFTTAAGSTNSTLGDPVGREESLITPQNNATQGTGGARPLKGRMPYGWIKNVLASGGVQSEGISGWIATNVTITAAVSGILCRIRESAATDVHGAAANANIPIITGTTYTGFMILKVDSGDQWCQLTMSATGFPTTIWANFDLTNGVVGSNIGAGVVDSEIRAVPASLVAEYPELSGAYICMVQGISTSTVSNSGGLVLALTNNTDAASRLPSYAGNAGSGVFYSRVQLASGARDIDWYLANYQTVTAAYDITESGVASIPALWFDGTDDNLSFGIQEWSANGDYFADTGHATSDAFAFSTFKKNATVGIAKASGTAGNRTFQTLTDTTSGKLRSIIRGTSVENNTSDLTTGRWHFVVRIINGGTVTLYVDGTAYTPTVGSAAEEAENLIFGARTESGVGQAFNGFMVPVISEDRVWSAGEIAQVIAWGRSYFGSP